MGWRRRRGGNPDQNQNPLVAFARRLGASVEIISVVGHGCPDALVGFRLQNLLWEFKRPGAIGKRGKKLKGGQLKPKQERFLDTWMGRIELIETADDVVRSLLQADMNRPMDYQTVPDDYLAAVTKTIRGNLPQLVKGA